MCLWCCRSDLRAGGAEAEAFLLADFGPPSGALTKDGGVDSFGYQVYFGAIGVDLIEHHFRELATTQPNTRFARMKSRGWQSGSPRASLLPEGAVMLSFTSTDSAPLEIRGTITQPMVYLDYCIVANLAADSAGRGRQFREVLERAGGTLFLSWAHIVELFALGAGPTFDRIAAYLGTFGGRFAIIDADPHAVISREKNWRQGRQNPALDEDFMRLLAKNWDGTSEMSLGILLDAIVNETEFFETIKVLHRNQKANLKMLFDQQRERYRVDRGTRQLLDKAQYPYSAPAFMTEKIFMELTRECVRTNEQFNPSDGLDFYHAVVSISYCTHVVFDKKWARRCGKVELPKPVASVFDGTQMDELFAALDSCRLGPQTEVGVNAQTVEVKA